MCYLINKSPIFKKKKEFTSGLKLYMGSPQKKKKKKIVYGPIQID